MKYLKRFNENRMSDHAITNDIADFIEEKYPNTIVDISLDGNSIDVERCDTEPEHGSYSEKTNITIYINFGHQYKISIEGISGQYGSDEVEDDEMDVEPEFDWQMGASKIKAKATLSTIEEVKEFISKELDEYLK